jgi:predicted Zn-dependent protease
VIGADQATVLHPLDEEVARGRIAALEGQPSRADYWFQLAEKTQPHIPFADAAWGEALLTRGQPDAAIAKFTSPARKARTSLMRWKCGVRR